MKYFAILLLCFAHVAQAEVVNTLYDARVPVAERSESALKRAASQGLADVLVRVSGRADVAQGSTLQSAMRDAHSLLRQYRYDTVIEDGRQSLLVDLSFSEVEVNRLLSQSGLPVWDKNRPRTLAWLAIDDVSGRQFVNEIDYPEIVATLREAADRRGLPLVFPVLDIDDRLVLTTGQVWAMDLAAVRSAAERYRAAHILTGRLTRLSTGWIANLAHLDASDENLIDTQSADLQAVLTPAVNGIADALAEKYAVVRSGQEARSANIVVSGVEGFRDYARLLTYLESVVVIEHANPVWIAGSQLVIQLHLEGAMEKAQQFFLLDKKILEDDMPDMAFAESNIPAEQIYGYYRWQNL